MQDNFFRKKSMNRVHSMEELNDHIKVVTPKVWMLLVVILLLIVGSIVWGVLGHLDTVLEVGAVTEQGRTICYVKEADILNIEQGMKVMIDEKEAVVDSILAEPVNVDENFSKYVMHVGNLSLNDSVYSVLLEEFQGEEGTVYEAEIIIDQVTPATFFFN